MEAEIRKMEASLGDAIWQWDNPWVRPGPKEVEIDMHFKLGRKA